MSIKWSDTQSTWEELKRLEKRQDMMFRMVVQLHTQIKITFIWVCVLSIFVAILMYRAMM